jgi:hypothetical protein
MNGTRSPTGQTGTLFMIDATRCQVIAVSTDHRFLVTAALNTTDIERWAAQRVLDEARIITLNSTRA